MKRIICIRILLVLILLPSIYFLSAPPILKAIIRRQHSGEIPGFYSPIRSAWESTLFGPFALWYFNDVWHCDIEILVEPMKPGPND